jgi:hypothetical protein
MGAGPFRFSYHTGRWRIAVILSEAPRDPVFSRKPVAPSEESGSATAQRVERGLSRGTFPSDGSVGPSTRFFGRRTGGGALWTVWGGRLPQNDRLGQGFALEDFRGRHEARRIVLPH